MFEYTKNSAFLIPHGKKFLKINLFYAFFIVQGNIKHIT